MAFVTYASADLETLELMERSRQIENALDVTLPPNWQDFSTLVRRILAPQTVDQTQGGAGNVQGWIILPLSHCIARRADGHLIEALDLLKQLTPRFTAEFAIRHFLAQYPTPTLMHLSTWLNDPCEHVRRLISEGTRPRLPWGKQLPLFRQQPQLTLPFLMALRDDTSAYVRRSVANHLNDIGKDHPDVLVSLAEDWWTEASRERQQLLRHALRQLLKFGQPRALALMNASAEFNGDCIFQVSPHVAEGEALELRLSLHSRSQSTQSLRLDFLMDYVKASGRRSGKVFRWKNIFLGGNESIELTKLVSFRPVTTRRLYPGEHRVRIHINGVCRAEASFDLTTSRQA